MKLSAILLFMIFFSAAGRSQEIKLPMKDSLQKDIGVNVDGDNKIYIGAQEIPLSKLYPIIKSKTDSLKSLNYSPRVVISTDTSASTGTIYEIMLAAKRTEAKVVLSVKK